MVRNRGFGVSSRRGTGSEKRGYGMNRSLLSNYSHNTDDGYNDSYRGSEYRNVWASLGGDSGYNGYPSGAADRSYNGGYPSEENYVYMKREDIQSKVYSMVNQILAEQEELSYGSSYQQKQSPWSSVPKGGYSNGYSNGYSGGNSSRLYEGNYYPSRGSGYSSARPARGAKTSKRGSPTKGATPSPTKAGYSNKSPKSSTPRKATKGSKNTNLKPGSPKSGAQQVDLGATLLITYLRMAKLVQLKDVGWKGEKEEVEELKEELLESIPLPMVDDAPVDENCLQKVSTALQEHRATCRTKEYKTELKALGSNDVHFSSHLAIALKFVMTKVAGVWSDNQVIDWYQQTLPKIVPHCGKKIKNVTRDENGDLKLKEVKVRASKVASTEASGDGESEKPKRRGRTPIPTCPVCAEEFSRVNDCVSHWSTAHPGDMPSDDVMEAGHKVTGEGEKHCKHCAYKEKLQWPAKMKLHLVWRHMDEITQLGYVPADKVVTKGVDDEESTKDAGDSPNTSTEVAAGDVEDVVVLEESNDVVVLEEGTLDVEPLPPRADTKAKKKNTPKKKGKKNSE